MVLIKVPHEKQNNQFQREYSTIKAALFVGVAASMGVTHVCKGRSQ